MHSTQITHAINAATATAVSGWLPITGARAVQIMGKRSANAGGTTTFTVHVSPDGVDANAIAYNKLIDNVTNTNAQTLTRIASKAIANADGLVLLSISPEDIGGFIRITATETTDGTHDAWLIVAY